MIRMLPPRLFVSGLLSLASAAVLGSCSGSSTAHLRLDDVQLKGTHNSYHRRPRIVVHPEHDYEHAPLDVQLESFGVRVFELDVHARRGGGFSVFHLPVIDAASTCDRLSDCLSTIKTWSDANPDHVPIFVWIEPKDDIDWGNPIDDYDALDAEILSVWPRDRLITPSLVRGEHASLREAIETFGWPRLDAVRGRAMFLLLDTGEHRRGYRRARDGRTAVREPVMFSAVTTRELDKPFAAVTKINDPRHGSISQALERGLIVGSNVGRATESDETNREKLEAGLRRGVHLLKGDFPAPADGRSYSFEMPGNGVWRERRESESTTENGQ